MSLILVYFVYGLAFFSMGLAMLLESRRSPLLAEGKLLRPLALFGFVHGIHEWVELDLRVRAGLGEPVSVWLPWFRLALLVISFTVLFLFGLRGLRPSQKNSPVQEFLWSAGLLGLFGMSVFLSDRSLQTSASGFLTLADALSRYTLAVPGAALAALILKRQADRARGQQLASLGLNFGLAAWGFALYGLTQVFVPPVDLFPARFVNVAAFMAFTGIPIQVFRAALAVVITFALIRASQVVEDERQRQHQAAQQARLEALEQVRLDLAEREVLRRELLRHTVIAQEDERARIARELHDETAQFLTALRLNLAALTNTIPKTPEAAALVNRLQSLGRQMSQGIYRMVHDLRPAQLDDLGLAAALQSLADEERRRSGLEVTLQLEGPARRLDSLVETVFFRVAQEALANAARHAGCGQADLLLRFTSQEAVLQVVDLGKGFDPAQHHIPPHGWGLAGMRERADSVGGRLTLQSAPGRGTRVELVVPLPPSRPDLSKGVM